jgi:hypothetical protein
MGGAAVAAEEHQHRPTMRALRRRDFLFVLPFVDRATDRSTVSVSMPVSRSRNGAGKDGYIPPIRAAGSNGTAATAWCGECPTRTLVRSNAGKQFVVTCVSFNWLATPVICGVADGSGRRCSIGPMTAANSDRSGRVMEPRSNLHRGTAVGRPVRRRRRSAHRQRSLSV